MKSFPLNNKDCVAEAKKKNAMNFYFKRSLRGNTPLVDLTSYGAYIGGLISMMYCLWDTSSAIHKYSARLTAFFFAICAVCTFISMYQEYKETSKCNVYTLLRGLISTIGAVVFLCCIDALIK